MNWSTCTYSGIQWGSLFFITRLILVRIWSECLPKHGSTIIKSFLDTVLATTLCVHNLKNVLYICQQSHVGNHLYTKVYAGMFGR